MHSKLGWGEHNISRLANLPWPFVAQQEGAKYTKGWDRVYIVTMVTQVLKWYFGDLSVFQLNTCTCIYKQNVKGKSVNHLNF